MDAEELFKPDRVIETGWGAQSYAERGSGKPVILIHGFGRSRHDWLRIAGSLVGRRIIIPDLCGHGGSDLPEGKFFIKDLASDIISIANKLWLGKFDLAGHGTGGMIALCILRDHPERIGRVALVEAFPKLQHLESFGEDTTEGLEVTERKKIIKQYRETLVRWMPGIREAFWNSVEDFDATELLASTPHDIRVICGDRGKEKPRREELGLPRRERIELQFVRGGSHYLPLTHARELGESLRQFFIGDEESPNDEKLPPADLSDLSMIY